MEVGNPNRPAQFSDLKAREHTFAKDSLDVSADIGAVGIFEDIV